MLQNKACILCLHDILQSHWQFEHDREQAAGIIATIENCSMLESGSAKLCDSWPHPRTHLSCRCLPYEDVPHAGCAPHRARSRHMHSQQTSAFPPLAAAEVVTLRDAVMMVREAAVALQTAVDAAQQPLLRLNLREARDVLARRLEQLSPECSGGPGAQAASEATMLLVELDSVL